VLISQPIPQLTIIPNVFPNNYRYIFLPNLFPSMPNDFRDVIPSYFPTYFPTYYPTFYYPTYFPTTFDPIPQPIPNLFPNLLPNLFSFSSCRPATFWIIYNLNLIFVVMFFILTAVPFYYNFFYFSSDHPFNYFTIVASRC
jgi:hypothetical protein